MPEISLLKFFFYARELFGEVLYTYYSRKKISFSNDLLDLVVRIVGYSFTAKAKPSHVY